VKPGDSSLDDPAGFAQPAAVRFASSGDFGIDTDGVQDLQRNQTT
jgi:hypothetical protein